MTIKDLKPANVFAIFDEINHVPRPSKKKRKYVSTSSTSPLNTISKCSPTPWATW